MGGFHALSKKKSEPKIGEKSAFLPSFILLIRQPSSSFTFFTPPPIASPPTSRRHSQHY